MNKLEKFVVAAFMKGSDYFEETVLENGPLTKQVRVFLETKPLKTTYYTMSLKLIQPDGHPCTSSIGLYYTKDGKGLTACSGHMMEDVLEITPDIQELLDNAELSPF